MLYPSRLRFSFFIGLFAMVLAAVPASGQYFTCAVDMAVDSCMVSPPTEEIGFQECGCFSGGCACRKLCPMDSVQSQRLPEVISGARNLDQTGMVVLEPGEADSLAKANDMTPLELEREDASSKGVIRLYGSPGIVLVTQGVHAWVYPRDPDGSFVASPCDASFSVFHEGRKATVVDWVRVN